MTWFRCDRMVMVAGVLLCGSLLSAAQVNLFSPTGSVKKVQQVTVRFSDAMVAMGDPRSKQDPFTMTCNMATKKEGAVQTKASQEAEAPKYTTRWADDKNWVIDFDKPLKSGLRCTFRLKSEVKDIAGNKVEGLEEYSFSTAGPALLDMMPRYNDIEPDQYFVARVDGAIDPKSVMSKAYFEVEGLPDKVLVKIIEGKAREDVVRLTIKNNWQWNQYEDLLQQKKRVPFSQIKEMNDFIVLAATRRFPESAKVIFHWPQGILSQSGVAVEEAQHFDFKVIKPFQAEFSCDRTAPDRACNPILDMRVYFTKSVSRRLLHGSQLVDGKGKILSPQELISKDKINKNAGASSSSTSAGSSSSAAGNAKISSSSNTAGAATIKGSSLGGTEDEPIDFLTFKAPFPESTTFKVILPKAVKDELGRPLMNQNKYPLEVATDEYSPLIKFSAPFGIIELKADPVLPVSVRNIESPMALQQMFYEGKSLNLSSQTAIAEIINWYHKVKKKDDNYTARKDSLLTEKQGEKFSLPKPLGAREFELVGIPLKKPGFYIVEVASPNLGKALLGGVDTMYVATAALVTDMAVHFKKGRESSLVWVTQLSSGKPVKGAKVSVRDSKGVELISGVTNGDGILRFGEIKDPCVLNSNDIGSENPGSDVSQDDGNEAGENSCEIFAFAQKDKDISFTSTFWSKGIETYRYSVPTEYLSRKWGPVVMHTILNRMAAQPGDVIQMKHVLREHREQGFSMMNEKRLPKRVLIIHQGSQKTYTLPFEFDKKTGTALGAFTLPKDATLGRYSIYLSNKELATQKRNTTPGEQAKSDINKNSTTNGAVTKSTTGSVAGSANGTVNSNSSEAAEDIDPSDWEAQETGYFIVSEYRLPLMKASIKIQGEPLIQPTEVKADLSAHYLSGGPAKGLKTKIRSRVQAGYFVPDVPGGSDYNFFANPMKVGIFDADDYQATQESFIKLQELTLSAEGGVLAAVTGLPKVHKIQQLVMEMEYTDPNGEVKTTSAQTSLFPAEVVIGLRTDSWYSSPGKTKVEGVVTNTLGKPQKNRSYIVEAFRTNRITHRKRLVGGFYSYDSKSEVSSLGKVCEGKSDELGRFECSPQNLPAGSITLQAKAFDDKNRSTYARADVSIYESGADSWWTPGDSDRIDLLPERNRYEPGEKAKLVVRSPFPTATVLVTVEREGILDSFVTEIHRDHPIIEIPLKGHYAPNVFVSALVIRGRVGDPKPTALLDLAKPSMKMGVTELKVGWATHELAVSVKADKTKYRAREKAQVTIAVKPPNGKKLPAGTEVAVIAVDESLLRLKENSSWKILQEMMGQRRLAVVTSTGQNQVVGRRHFGSKAKPPGGDGGGFAADVRELFEPILLWQPRVLLDAAGEAKVTVPLNDSMTSFRIVAVVIGGEGLFGEGSTTIASSKDLIIYSGFSPMVREGDQIKNAFTIRNTTTQPMTVKLEVSAPELQALPKAGVGAGASASASGVAGSNSSVSLPPLADVILKPSEARTIDLPLTVPQGLKLISFRITARDLTSGSEDILVTKVRVEPALPPRVLQATLFQLEKNHKILVKLPADAILGLGGMGLGGLGVQARATLVGGLAGVKSYMENYSYSCLEQKISRAIVLEDSKELKRLIEILPTYLDQSGLLKFFPSSLCGSAQLTRYVMTILKENGYEIPQATRSQIISGLSAYVQGKYSCRSWWDDWNQKNRYGGESKILVMDALSRYNSFSSNLLATVQLTPNLWKNETLVAWYHLLKRQAEIPNRATQLKQTETILRSRVNFQGSLMNLQNEGDWEGRWQLLTSNDQEALGVFRIFMDEKDWGQDAGRMARGLIARLRLGHWDTTMANAWGLTQFRYFSEKFEKETIRGETKIQAGEIVDLFNWRSTPKGDRKLLNWPKGSDKNNVTVQWTHIGAGKPWIHFETSAAIPLKAPLDMGYKITRKLTPVVQSTPGAWQVGDVVNVELNVTAKADQAWVVVRDPIPAGAAHLGTGLDGSSQLLDRAPKRNAQTTEVQGWPTEFEEKSQSNFISYAAYLPRGTYSLNYRVRLNAAGEFKLPPSRVEAMYAPESFGEIPNANWKVNSK